MKNERLVLFTKYKIYSTQLEVSFLHPLPLLLLLPLLKFIPFRCPFAFVQKEAKEERVKISGEKRARENINFHFFNSLVPCFCLQRGKTFLLIVLSRTIFWTFSIPQCVSLHLSASLSSQLYFHSIRDVSWWNGKIKSELLFSFSQVTTAFKTHGQRPKGLLLFYFFCFLFTVFSIPFLSLNWQEDRATFNFSRQRAQGKFDPHFALMKGGKGILRWPSWCTFILGQIMTKS